MKRIIIVLLLSWSSMICFGQKDAQKSIATPYPIRIDSITKKITYEGVVEVNGVPAKGLYKRINEWVHAYYKNPSEVIRDVDSTTKFIIVGKPMFRLNNPPDKDGSKVMGGVVQYTITLTSKDGRFKYELTDFNFKQASYFACERWLDTKAPTYAPVHNDYLQQLEKYSLETINSLKNSVMKEKAVKDKDSW